jgi:hypothetical protein
MLYVPTKEEKQEAELACHRIIGSLEGKDIGFKAYVLQILMESFEDTYNVKIREGIGIKEVVGK